MTSEPASAHEVFVWTWLPGATEPVVAGRVVQEQDRYVFNYGRSYLAREDRIALYLPELPLVTGAIEPRPGLAMAGCLRDGAPDAWGRRVILNHRYGRAANDMDPAALGELAYLLESGSDRIGCLDFQASATRYQARASQGAPLEELQQAAARVDLGLPLTPALEQALYHGTSLGGARPKAMIETPAHKWIAKFSSSSDTFNVVKSEFVAMRLAALAGLDVAVVQLTAAAGRDVLLIQRFDRQHTADGYQRRAMVSALTILELDELMARYASYETLAEIVRHRFDAPVPTLHELFGRLVFNVLCGNTDDHARNHAAFWNGSSLALTPAYDICPQARAGNEASQAMLIVGQQRSSRLATCLQAAPHFLLDDAAATALIARQITSIQQHFDAVCQEAGLAEVDRNLLRARNLLNPAIFEGAPDALQRLVAGFR
ncbi:MAG: HipA domain-containing protein [Stenotrophomonas sp.]